MPGRRPLTLHTALWATLALLGSMLAVAGPAGPADALTKGDPDYQRPVVGQCHAYSYRVYQAPADDSAPVDCAGRHTAVTVAVVTAPRHLSLGGRHPSRVFQRVGRQCYAAVDATLGGTAATRARTAYGFAFFVPTRAQLQRGARWVRCDLVLFGGTRLRPLPAPLLTGLDDSVRRCLRLRSGHVLVTSCDRAHGYRSTHAYRLAGHRYPGVRALQRSARAHCARLVPRGRGWFASWPSADDWRLGHRRQLVCYRQSTH